MTECADDLALQCTRFQADVHKGDPSMRGISVGAMQVPGQPQGRGGWCFPGTELAGMPAGAPPAAPLACLPHTHPLSSMAVDSKGLDGETWKSSSCEDREARREAPSHARAEPTPGSCRQSPREIPGELKSPSL